MTEISCAGDVSDEKPVGAADWGLDVRDHGLDWPGRST